MNHYFATEGGTLAFDLYEPAVPAQGSPAHAAPLLILVAGIGDLRDEYRLLAPRLAQAGMRVATLDLRGHGDSSTAWAEHTPQAVGRDMLALADHLGGGPVLLGGCSMAAASAVWAAVERPQQVAGVLMFGPSLEDGAPGVLIRVAMGVLFRGPWRVRAWDAFYASLYPGPKPADLDAYRARLRSNLAQPGRFDAVHAFLGASKQECAQRIEQVQAPVLLIMGSLDPDFKQPEQMAQAWAARLHGQALLVEGAGHYPHVDSPDAVASAILEWNHTAVRASTAQTEDRPTGGNYVEVPVEP